ncbi:sensor histidine kinase [Streptomonospora litoralis]|uniref:histidine kinase n=1 Tax=Streptomonospora litoralis TaxID=2498135 RepID=A0A4P6Q4W3_9ACTN|nr:sensor histidine kinase [Streptomonospora litoralis]QBI55748.1 Phytochrome-like protein cph1 [Streptomonospora litoralis]
MRKWPLRRRVTVLLSAVAVVLVACVSTITLAAFDAREALDRQVDELTPAQSAVRQTMSAYLNMDNGIRGYALTNDIDFLAPYQQGKQDLAESLPQLRSIADQNSDVDGYINRLIEAGRDWQEDFAEPTLEKVHAGQEITSEDYRLGRSRFDDLRAAGARAEQRIDEELSQAREGLTLATQQVVALLVLVGMVVVILCAFLWVMLQNWVLRPLDELGSHLMQVSEGYYAHRIELHGPPEIERVGRDVDAMRERIVKDLDEVGTARRTLQEQSELLERQRDELRRSNLELEQFAYVASHDLQEPLRKVASFCQLLQRRYRGQLDERADSYIDYAVEGAKRMQTLINDLLAFSRVGRTKDDAPVELDEALADALSSLETRLEEADAVVTADDLPTVLGDRTLLTQVFFNLIGNAVKFRGEEPPRVHIGVERSGDEWVFCCSDNGIGIEPQYAERVFVIFQRLHTRDKYSGTGIGLAMCKKIVDFHGGRIWLDTSSIAETREEATGTRICWSLPVGDGDGEEAAAAQAEEAADSGPAEQGGRDREASAEDRSAEHGPGAAHAVAASASPSAHPPDDAVPTGAEPGAADASRTGGPHPRSDGDEEPPAARGADSEQVGRH